MEHPAEAAFWIQAFRRYAVTREAALPTWALLAGPGGRIERMALAPGAAWPDPQAERLDLAADLDVAWPRPRLAADLDGEALVRVDGAAVGALNPMHTTMDLDVAIGRHALVLETLPTGLWGVRFRPPRVRALTLQAVDGELEAAAYDLEVLVEWARLGHIGDAAREHAWRGIHEALRPLRALAPDLEAWRAWVGRPQAGADEEGLRAALLFGEGEAPQLRAVPELRSAMSDCARRLRALYRELAAAYPRGTGRVVAMGHAHIDLAWLWPMRVGHAKAVRTFATQAALLAAHPEARFGASAPEHYAAVEREAPELSERVAALASEGRFLPLGAFWLESDANLPGAEAIARHLLYGLRYFAGRLGVRPRTLFLPDTFGFARGLPTLLAAAGVELFCTTKLNWNDTTRFPYVDFAWVGPDGGVVQAHVFGQGREGYNGAATLGDVVDSVQRYERAGGRRAVLYAYGHGDGGGGPTAAMLERLARYRQLPLVPAIAPGGPEDLIGGIDGLPRYRGPLYLEYHRATYTSQSWTKHWGLRAEHALAAAEALEAWAGRDARARAQAEWRLLLRGQFHDILPGSSIRPVYTEIEAEWQALVGRAEERLRAAAQALAPAGVDALVVVNRSSQRSPAQALRLPAGVAGPLGGAADAHVQPLSDGDALVAVPALEPFGLCVLALGAADGPQAGAPRSAQAAPAAEVVLEHAGIRLVVRAEGIASLSVDGQNVTAGAVAAYRQQPERFDAWKLVAPEDREPIVLAHAAPALVEDGPLRSTVRLAHRTPEGSEVVEEVSLDRVQGQVEVACTLSPRERHLVIAYALATTLCAEAAEAAGLVGTERHLAVPDGPAEAARFEWPAHPFVDLSESALGLAVLDDGRYGHAFRDGTLSVTLLTTPLYPDPRADESPAPARLALVPHRGDWRAADVDRRARSLAAGLAAWRDPAAPTAPRAPLVGLPAALRLLAFKGAEDGSGDVVAHLLEARGERGVAHLVPAFAVEDAWLVDLVDEVPRDDASVRLAVDRAEGALHLTYTPYAPIFLRMRPVTPA